MATRGSHTNLISINMDSYNISCGEQYMFVTDLMVISTEVVNIFPLMIKSCDELEEFTCRSFNVSDFNVDHETLIPP